MAKKRINPSERPSAVEWLTSNRWPALLPTPWLTDAELEDFTEALLTAQRLLGANVRHVAHIERWGVPGDKQDGIDFFGHFNDGVPAAWQVKQLVKLGAAEVRDAVAAMTFDGAEELYLVYGGVAGKQARVEIRGHGEWTLLDRRTLTEMVRLLPAHAQRELIERFWGPEVRRLFLSAPGDAFVSLGVFKSDRLNPDSLMNDLGPLVGRETELTSLSDAMDRNSDGFRQIVVVTGPGGRGKSRLVVEALAAQQELDPTIPIFCLSAQHTFDAAAMNELRGVPSIVFIDDAHNDPSALAPLLAAVRSQPDIQVILATRPSALAAVEERILLAPFGPDQRTTVEVAELELAQARALVKGLTEDLNLRFDLRNYLADQATHSPHVAVILTNLIRTRQLNDAIAVDGNLRNIVLARYQELLVPGDIEGFDAKTTRRVIATYASLQPIQQDDEALKARIAAFCDLTVIELAQLVRILTDRGVLVAQNDKLRVVPEVLADHVTEIVAVFEKYDTGFVAGLWNEFGADHHHRLALSLGELDWRLTRSGGPDVMARVWDDIRDRLKIPYCSRLCDELDQLEQLAATQPAELVAALDELRQRLDQEDAAGTPVLEDPDDRPYQALWRLRPRDRNDVRAKMPKLYARAAANDPDVLEQVLDALWALRKNDPRPTNSNPDHAERMVADHLANLATLPNRSFPERIVARAALWLEQPAEDDSVATPLFVLKPLLAKNELETVQSSFRKLEFRPHLISAKAMRPVRDQIRALLLQQGVSTALRLAGAAVHLLGEAFQAVHGYFGQAIGTDAILQWEADDLASVATLAQIADQTQSAVIRRQVREVVSWNAEHATSLRLQHAAMTLAGRLDANDDLEDQVAELVFRGEWGRSLERIDHVPTLEELKAQRQEETERTKEFTEEQKQEERQAQIRSKVENRDQYVAARNENLTRRLIDLGDAHTILELLDRTAREVQQVREDKHIILLSLWNQFEQQAPELLGPFVAGIASNVPGPLDNDLDLIVDRWVRSNPADAIEWVQDAAGGGRKEVRLAIAYGFARAGWHQHADEFTAIWTQGLTDEDPDVVQAFLRGAGGYLNSNPVEAVGMLLRHNISPAGATRVLEDACSYDGRKFGTSLDLETGTEVLPLITRAGLDSYAVQEIVTGMATVHPELVLDYLAELTQGDALLRDDIHELRSAFDQHAEALAHWVRERLNQDPTTTGHVLDAAVNEHLTPTQADALAAICDDLDGAELAVLVGCLASLKLWAVDHPVLAEAVMRRARDTETADEVLDRVRRHAMTLRGWGWTNGVSDELNHAHAASAKAAETTSDDDLRATYIDAMDRFRASIDELAQEHQREEDEDW
jgi:AAA ATPase domain